MAEDPVAERRRRYDEYVAKRGDELELIRAVASHAPIGRVAYPGSYIHITPSLVFDAVTYVDTDAKARWFFQDLDAVRTLVRTLRGAGHPAGITFHGVDYADVPEPDASFDLLISLYAGFVSQACGRLLRPGGLMLANNSHGDASMAALDPGFELVAAITRSNRVRSDQLASYMQPKSGVATTVDDLRRTRRGVAFTRDAKAYLFRRRSGWQPPI